MRNERNQNELEDYEEKISNYGFINSDLQKKGENLINDNENLLRKVLHERNRKNQLEEEIINESKKNEAIKNELRYVIYDIN